MLKIQRILCPVDFFLASERAYDYAYSLAMHYGARLYLQHVVDVLMGSYPSYALPGNIYVELDKVAKERLENMLKLYSAKQVQQEAVVHKGLVPESILSYAKDERIDLIVMGTHGRRGLSRLMMGSVTENVLRNASCPVLAVREPAHDFVNVGRSEEPVRLRKILMCTDFSKSAGAALSYALSLSQEYNAELTLLHVIEGSLGKQPAGTEGEVRQKLEMLVPADARNWCTAKTEVRTGKPYEEIIQLATEQQSDLVVVGVRGRSATDLAIFGSTTQRVLRLGPCPVLAVQEGAGA